MLFLAAGCAVCDGNACHAQIPYSDKRNDQRQDCQDYYSSPPPSFFSIQL
jgi:hypothetical protein